MISRNLMLAAACRLNAVLTVATGLSGCAIVSSHTQVPERPPSGMLYHLPKAVLPVELVAKGGALELRMQAAKQVADPAQRYLLTHPTNLLASDNVNVVWDSSGLLLNKLTMDSTEQTLNVLKEVARSTAIGRAEAAAAAGEVILADGDFDPDLDQFSGSNAALMTDLQSALKRTLDLWARQCADASLAKDVKPDAENCMMATQLLPRFAANEPILGITTTPMKPVPAESAPADCSIGLCYRGQQPFVLGLQVSGLFSRRTVLMLPNQSPAIALSLDRAPFVKTEHTVEFQASGTLKSVDTKRPSSALQLATWPLDVYKAVLGATSELITLRIGAKDNEVKLAQKELETAKELKRLADEMDAFNKASPAGKKELAGSGGGGGAAALLSIPLGRRKVDSAASLFTDKPTPPAQGAKSECKAGEPCPGASATSAVK